MKLAIVGFGPRGLHALENLFLELSKIKTSNKIDISLFETHKELGSGKVWDTQQADLNLVNISERGLQDLQGRNEINYQQFVIPNFPSYTDWCFENDRADKKDVDTFPPRNKIGNYLKERCKSILKVLEKENCVQTYNTLITDINQKKEKLILKDIDKNQYEFDEVLLTIGHQTTEIPKDIKKYQENALNGNFICLPNVYPIQKIIDFEAENKNIAIRGFGLAMIDAVRALTIGNGGKFVYKKPTNFESEFKTSNKIPNKIIPYSLDGLPVIPKPLSEKIDNQFAVSKEQLKAFENRIREVANNKENVRDNSFLIEEYAKITANIFLNIYYRREEDDLTEEDIKNVIFKWLTNQEFKHKLIQKTNIPTEKLIYNYVQMACGKKKISLDFCAGQVIRHCQPTLYKSFSHAAISEEIIADVIQFDEKMKRYSYGPPLESMQQLLALHKANILDFSVVDNPNIQFTKNGWIFEKDNHEIRVDCIIDSVLSSPELLKVNTPIIKNLLRNDVIQPIHSKLGIHTNTNGTIIFDDKKTNASISVLGRLAKGSVIGVDAILECFGPRVNDWAKGLVSRI
ncbi:FAD/NAD(P)-binding protein [Polaribacter porphyrae]|nr:FAD/NAD(P)-binding domain-containing protein [Polaribacter porphyrae]